MIPYHIHNGYDSPKIKQASTTSVIGKIYVGTAQTVANNSLTIVDFDTSSISAGTTNNTTDKRIEIIEAGYYQINAQICYTAGVDAKTYYLYIFVNTTSQSVAYNQASITTPLTVSISNLLYLNAGDYVQCKTYQDSGSNASIRAGLDDSILIVNKI